MIPAFHDRAMRITMRRKMMDSLFLEKRLHLGIIELTARIRL